MVKNALKAIIGRSTLNEDQLQTFLMEVENVVNNRPLSYVGDDPLDLSPLTPAHFLLGTASKTLPDIERDVPSTSNNIRQLWRKRLREISSFKKRWQHEYLQQLRSAHHQPKMFSSDIKPGDVVLLHDSSLQRMFWRLAVIEEVYPGRDNKIRSCQIRLNDGKRLRRPVQFLYPLELQSSLPPAGGCEK